MLAMRDASFILITPCRPEVMGGGPDRRVHALFQRRPKGIALCHADYLPPRGTNRSTRQYAISNSVQRVPMHQQLDELGGIALFVLLESW